VPRALWLIVGGAIAEAVRERSGVWIGAGWRRTL